MADPFIGEIRQFAGNFAPLDWAFCNGQLMSIQDNEALFSLIGTTYGGDGQTNFGMPNLQGRVPLHQGSGFVVGQLAGQEQVTLTTNQLPVHTHPAAASGTGGIDKPAGNVWGTSAEGVPYAPPPGTITMNAGSTSVAGGSQPHNNMHPYLAVSFIISLAGIYPSQQ